jgi:creatinine amidohydrolase
MLLALSTWPEVEAYLTRCKGIIIPVGSMEQHGPSGLIGTDSICPQVIAEHAARDADVLVGPAFNVGSAQHHLAFAGTLTLQPSTMIAAMLDWCRSLRRHGFTHIYWLNGHGGNSATLQAAFAEMHAERSLHAGPGAPPALTLVARNWWELPSVMDVCRRLHPAHDGMHATASEISVTWAAYPHQVRRVALKPKVAPTGPFGDAEDYRARFPDGRIGSDPSQASVAAGEEIIRTASMALLADFQSFLTR